MLGLTGAVVTPLGGINDNAGVVVLGVALIVTGVILEFSALDHGKNRQRAEVYETLFVEQPLVPRLANAALQYNQAAAQRCRFTGTVTVPRP